MSELGSRRTLYQALLDTIDGEDVVRQGLIATPERAAKAFDFFTKGYTQNIEETINEAIFDESYDEMIIVRNIDFYSLCEHHLLPFFGKCHVAYIPDGKIIGLSKIPRLVEVFARRLQVQERLTNQIADVIDEMLNPKAVGVVVEGQHLCMMMRGVEKQEAVMQTNSMRGAFKSSGAARQEFLEAMKG